MMGFWDETSTRSVSVDGIPRNSRRVRFSTSCTEAVIVDAE